VTDGFATLVTSAGDVGHEPDLLAGSLS